MLITDSKVRSTSTSPSQIKMTKLLLGLFNQSQELVVAVDDVSHGPVN